MAREPLQYLVAVSAVVILVSAAQAAMLGLSRLGYALAVNRQIPSRFGSLHSHAGDAGAGSSSSARSSRSRC